jgi:hypothetical protein
MFAPESNTTAAAASAANTANQPSTGTITQTPSQTIDMSGQQFNLGRAELIDGNKVFNESSNLFNTMGKGDVVNLHFSAGTD